MGSIWALFGLYLGSNWALLGTGGLSLSTTGEWISLAGLAQQLGVSAAALGAQTLGLWQGKATLTSTTTCLS